MNVHDILEAIGLLVIGLLFYSYVRGLFQGQPHSKRRWQPVVLGLGFGVLSVILMRAGIQLDNGVFIDARNAPIALIGFGTVGFGIANVIPVLFSGAANVRGAGTGSALAAVATTGYFGFLAGPAVIGFTAELTSLPIGLALVSAACVVIAFRGGIIQAPVELC